MTPEVAILDVIPEKTAEFELSFQKAQEILSSIIIIHPSRLWSIIP
jgi:hypothetical protein